MVTNNAINLSSQGVPYYNGSGSFTAPALTQFGVIVGGVSNGITNIAVGATGTALIGSTGANPSFSSTVSLTSLSVSNLSATNATLATLSLTSPLPVSSGGTGNSSLSAHGILVGEGTSSIVGIPLTNGQVLIGSTGSDPVASTLTQGSGVSIANAAGAITISLTGAGGITWNHVTANTAATAGNGYFIDSTAAITVTLAASPSFGDTVIVQEATTGTVTILANTKTIAIGPSIGTTSAVSTLLGDSLTLTYDSSGTTWYARAVQGNWSIT